MILQIVDPFDIEEKYIPLLTVNTQSKGFTKLTLKYAINQPNELTVLFNTNLPRDIYYALKDNEYGLRIQKDGHDMLFVQDKSSKKVDSMGNVEVNFFSSIYKAAYSQPSIINRQFIRASAITTANLIRGFEFIAISPDRTINLATGFNTNLDILDLLRKSTGGWSYFDTGLSPRGDGTFTNRILLGDYNNIDFYGAIDSRFSKEKVSVSRVNGLFNKNPILLDVNVFFNGRQVQFLLPILDTGGGAAANNSSETFRRTDYSFVDPVYPLVNLDGIIYIQDTNYTGLQERYLTYPVTLTAASDNGNGASIYNTNDALDYLYNKAVFYLKSQRDTKRLETPFAFRKLTFPKYLSIKIDKQITNRLKQKIDIYNIDEITLFNSFQFDLTTL